MIGLGGGSAERCVCAYGGRREGGGEGEGEGDVGRNTDKGGRGEIALNSVWWCRVCACVCECVRVRQRVPWRVCSASRVV